MANLSHHSISIRQAGTLFIVAAPSGAGKTSLVKALLREHPEIQLSISLTTRSARPGELHGKDYHFVSNPQFDQAANSGDLLEWASVHGYRYGTSATWVNERLSAGSDVLLEIDWQGARQVRRKIEHTIGIFILPPSLGVLEQRLRDRGQDSDEVIARRLINARTELEHAGEFDYTLVNEAFNDALNGFESIVNASRLRTRNQAAKHPDLFRSLGAFAQSGLTSGPS